jgi:hypothetical protein
MALGSTQPLTEMSRRNLPGGKGGPARKDDNLTAICDSTVWKILEPRRLIILRASTASFRISFTFLYIYIHTNSMEKTRTLLGNLIIAQLINELPFFYGIRMFIKLFTVRWWAMPWTKFIPPSPVNPMFKIQLNVILLPSRPSFSKWYLPVRLFS